MAKYLDQASADTEVADMAYELPRHSSSSKSFAETVRRDSSPSISHRDWKDREADANLGNMLGDEAPVARSSPSSRIRGDSEILLTWSDYFLR